eukprot:833590-Rhodomonas_salina.3
MPGTEIAYDCTRHSRGALSPTAPTAEASRERERRTPYPPARVLCHPRIILRARYGVAVSSYAFAMRCLALV